MTLREYNTLWRNTKMLFIVMRRLGLATCGSLSANTFLAHVICQRGADEFVLR